MTRKEFNAALKHHGFKMEMLWLRDTTGVTATCCGVVMNTKGKILRRATLARAIRERDADERRAAA